MWPFADLLSCLWLCSLHPAAACRLYCTLTRLQRRLEVPEERRLDEVASELEHKHKNKCIDFTGFISCVILVFLKEIKNISKQFSRAAMLWRNFKHID